MARLAIKGHVTRGSEVIALLEMLGGINIHNLNGNNENYVYCIIDNTKEIKVIPYAFSDKGLCIVTLEQFKEKFPYKTGDKVVQHNGATFYNSIYVIEQMKWVDNQVKYVICDLYWNNCKSTVTSKDLQSYKKETMEEKLMPRIDLAGYCKDKYIIDLGNYEIKEENGKTYAVRKQPEFPKTYGECCNAIGFCPNSFKWNNPFNVNRDTHPYIKHLDNLMESFYKLLTCKYAYLRMARNWKPDWEDYYSTKYVISYYKNEVELGTAHACSYTLAFPTKEMRDTFYNNFKELIENCKELL